MFPLSFPYEDVSRQDPLLKLNYANIMEVHGSCEIRVVPTPSDFRIQNKGGVDTLARIRVTATR
ncbi:hypothetical protein MKW94_015858 [Papaver nudicaule]|uniref:Uncharacterized protein n=1 Tax=Papaver nudicaule TaxID=74823 RepID=A0AA41VSC1_PAPNU|nr:hypothetical protein [Papaver nudicaule]